MLVSNIQERKIELIQWLSLIDDVSLIDKVAKVREESVSDWWDEVSDAEKDSIAKGIEQADVGKIAAWSSASHVEKAPKKQKPPTP